MKIETLENGDRKLELSEYERDILIQVVEYLRDHYDELEFSIRNFTLDQVNEVIGLLENFDIGKPNYFTEKKIKLLKRVFSEVDHLVGAPLIEEKEHWEDISYNLFKIIFDNLGSGKKYGGRI
ncbi:MAG: hypothetical protein OEY94_02270 [Alphaproteobacteria bacterium]|nr:hypothetical protein [Alphaproteobacteria bacterium]